MDNKHKRLVTVDEAYTLMSCAESKTRVQLDEMSYTGLSQEYVDRSRWSVAFTYTVKDEKDRYWSFSYDSPATEQQEMDDDTEFDIEDGKVVLYEVEPKSIETTVYTAIVVK